MSLKHDNKGFIFRSGPKKIEKKSFSSFWDYNSDDSYVDDFLGITETRKGKDLVALAGYKRAIGNFVNIVTGRSDIPVVYNSNNQSYTDGKKVTIGANLNDKKFDVAVGLALHEGSHIKLSDFNFLKNLEMNIPQEVYVLGEGKNVVKGEVLSMIKSLLNYVEDRRIDNYIFTTSPGYKGYYHSMYDKYFYSKNVDKGLMSSEYRTEEIESYMFRIINLHNKNRQLDALSGLSEIWNELDLRNVSRLSSSQDAFDVAIKIAEVVLNSIDVVKVNDGGNNTSITSSDEGLDDIELSDDLSSGGGGDSGDNTLSDEEFDDLLDAVENDNIGSGDGGSGDGGSVSGGKTIELPIPGEGDGSEINDKNDDGSDVVELSDRQKELLRKSFEKQKDFIDGDIKKTKLSNKDNKNMKSLEESGATYEDVGGGSDRFGGKRKTRCLVVKNLTQSIIDSNQFGCASTWNGSSYGSRWSYTYNFVEEGLRLGNILGRKLQVRSEETSTKYSRKDSGRIDKRLLAELGFNNPNVFSQTFVDKYNKAYLHISVDASSSMNGEKWNKAMTSTVAMIKACDMAGNIDVVVSIRSTHGGRNIGSDVPLIMVVFDSRKDKLTKVKKLFKYLNSSGTTPEGLCFEAIMKDLIPGNNNQESYFVNYSDGQPFYSNSDFNYGGKSADNHTRKQVENMRSMGIRVMSYFIGGEYEFSSDRNSFRTMYGNDAAFVNATNMMEVAREMNKRFLTK